MLADIRQKLTELYQRSKSDISEKCTKCEQKDKELQSLQNDIDTLYTESNYHLNKAEEFCNQVLSLQTDVEHQKKVIKELKRNKRSAQSETVQWKTKAEQLESVVKMLGKNSHIIMSK